MAASTHGGNEKTGDEHQEGYHVAQRAETPARSRSVSGKIVLTFEHDATLKNCADYCEGIPTEIAQQDGNQSERQRMGYR